MNILHGRLFHSPTSSQTSFIMMQMVHDIATLIRTEKNGEPPTKTQLLRAASQLRYDVRRECMVVGGLWLRPSSFLCFYCTVLFDGLIWAPLHQWGSWSTPFLLLGYPNCPNLVTVLFADCNLPLPKPRDFLGLASHKTFLHPWGCKCPCMDLS